MKFVKPKKKKQIKSHIPFRLNFLFFIVFLLFAALIAQLSYLQILYGPTFEATVERTDKTVITGDVPRGMIYDSKSRVLVGNKANSAVTYTKSVNVKAQKMLNVARRLAKFITVTPGKLSDWDVADFYLADEDNLKRIEDALPTSKTTAKDGTALTDGTIYKNAINTVIDQKIELTAAQKEVAEIYKTMNGATQLSTVYVKNKNMTEKEVAEVSENLTSLPGVNISTDWERSYPLGDTMRSIIGSVSSEKTGLPKEQLNSLLAQGYSRNDRIGTSYLEKQYESVLKGTKSQTQVEVGSDNQILSTSVLYKGSKGSNISLTIDSAYQELVEAGIKKVYAQAKAAGAAGYSDGAYAVAMNPQTGAVLAMAGEQNDTKTGEVVDDALGTINRTFVMGSAVKGATVLGGLMSGAISVSDNTLPDVPIYLPQTPIKKSVYPVGTFSSLNAVEALEVSSNIYMMRLAMKEGNATYTPQTYFNMNTSIFAKMRGYFAQFGLGVKTGIDLPGEASAYIGPSTTKYIGSALDMAYGNYDGYTLIQMAQYVSTIANGGYRMQPYIVNSIEGTNDKGEIGNTATITKPKVLSKIEATSDEVALVKQGFYNVVHGSNAWGTAHTLADITPAIAGKTGTAESFYQNPTTGSLSDTITTTFVGYAPANDPKIAIAIVFPNMTSENGHYNLLLAREMFTDYFKLNPIETK